MTKLEFLAWLNIGFLGVSVLAGCLFASRRRGPSRPHAAWSLVIAATIAAADHVCTTEVAGQAAREIVAKGYHLQDPELYRFAEWNMRGFSLGGHLGRIVGNFIPRIGELWTIVFLFWCWDRFRGRQGAGERGSGTEQSTGTGKIEA